MRHLDKFTFSEGDTIDIDGSFFEINGQAMNLTGAAVEWCIATSYADVPPPVFLATLGSGVVLVGAATLGTVKIEVHPGHVGRSAVLPGNYYHMARVVFPSGRISEQWGGPLEITESPFI